MPSSPEASDPAMSSPDSTSAVTRSGLPGLVLGAVLIGFAAIIVRLVDVGPTAAAFWRLAIAVPVLGLLRWRLQPRSEAPTNRRALGLMLLAGIAFALDLALWHRSIHLTSVANATLMSNLSPVFIALTLHFGFGDRHPLRFWIGLALALIGAGVLVADSFRISHETAIGDLLAVGTAVFYAIYQLLVSRSRRRYSALDVMFYASLAGAALLLPMALLSGERLLPTGPRDIMLLLALGLVVHIGGQGLIAWAQAHVTASFASVTLLVQPVAAAVFAWVLLGEGFGLQQTLGGIVILAGILNCRLAMPSPILPSNPPRASP
ncbi:DMT family transporter [Nevskia ramosa]|uniref:DMT family transporter n=1 Tax=Nevskia ramosa TaxID=64002 RepID=UPI003D0B738C